MVNENKRFDARMVSIFDELENRSDNELMDIYVYIEYTLGNRKLNKQTKSLREKYGDE